MTRILEPNRAESAGLLERHLKEVADELRTIDVFEIVTFIQTESHSAIEDLLQSSTELFFKEGTLTFAWSADVALAWDTPPFVRFGMEFRASGVSVFFDLVLSAFDGAVEIGGILFDREAEAGETESSRLAEALADARLPLRTAIR